VFNLIFKSGDLGSEPVSINFKVTDCPGEYIGFDLSYNSDTFSTSKSAFKLARAWVFVPGTPGMVPRARSWSLYSVKEAMINQEYTQI
jgi:hypothetical protein